jgi:hypothetical protein
VKLDIVPAEFFVHRHVYGKWACRCCQRLVQEAAVPQIIDGGMPAAGLVAHALISRLVDHLPYYRQEAINARSGVHTSRSTLAAWSGRGGTALECPPAPALHGPSRGPGPEKHPRSYPAPSRAAFRQRSVAAASCASRRRRPTQCSPGVLTPADLQGTKFLRFATHGGLSRIRTRLDLNPPIYSPTKARRQDIQGAYEKSKTPSKPSTGAGLRGSVGLSETA